MHVTSSASVRRLASIALAGAVFLLGACQDQSRMSEVNGPEATPVFASSSALPQIVNTSLLLPAAISADMYAYDCSNNPGPQITFSGLTVLGGFGVQMAFTNNLKGTHEYDTDANLVTTTEWPAGDEIVIPKQPVLGGVGGNPFIWLQWLNGDGTPASDEIFVGRCVQGAGWHVDGPTATTASAYATFDSISCENSPGPYITFDSGLSLGGLIARIIFRNNDNPVGGPQKADATTDITMIGSGTSFTFPKQPVNGGVGGNPWIFAGFTDGGGVSLSVNNLVGRCEQLSKYFSN